MGGAAALIEAVRGDLTRTAGVDAIVNAANSSLMGGGGVDGAIHRAGGPEVLEACRLLRSRQWPEGLPAGEAALTTGGRLPFRVIHTVGPVWRGGHEGEPETLARCYRRCIALAAREGLPRLAFPSISTGAYGYPVALAAPTAVRAVRAALAEHPQVSLVRFVLFSESDLRVYEEALRA